MSQSSRPEIKVPSSSRNPEYNIASSAARFKRGEDGRRIAPVSQLNTYAGRLLAREQAAKPLSYTEGLSLPANLDGSNRQPKFLSKKEDASRRPDLADRRCSSLDTGLSIMESTLDYQRCIELAGEASDRDRLPSQRPRTELSQLLGMTRGSSRKGTTRHTSTTESEISLSLICPECKQSDSRKSRGQTAGFSHICTTCRRFVPVAEITALHSSPLPAEPKETVPPVPPSKFPTGPLCNTCLSVPGYLCQEYLQFFPGCLNCGHMSDETLVDLIKNEGEITGLTDDKGKPIFGASKELQDWCVYIVHKAHNVSRHASLKSVATSIASTPSRGSSLTRSKAIRRTPTSSTSSSAASIRSRGTPASQGPRKSPSYTRRFSFDAIEEGLKPEPATATATEHPSIEYRMPFQDKGSKSALSLMSIRTTDTNETEMAYPAVIEYMAHVDRSNTQHRRRDEEMTAIAKVGFRPEVPRTFTEILGEKAREEPVRELRRQPGAHFLIPRFRQGALRDDLEENEDAV